MTTLELDPAIEITSRTIASPLGELTLLASERALVGVYFEGHRPAPRTKATRSGASEVLDEVERELGAYFADPSRSFSAELLAQGTELERAVWSELARIPVGTTRTYGEIARALGRPTAARAVGSAVGRNPLSIVVPCHRVVGKDGSLTGFAGGVERKAWLLAHEGAQR